MPGRAFGVRSRLRAPIRPPPMALPVVQVASSGQAPVITRVGVSNGVVTTIFTAGSGDTYSDFCCSAALPRTGPYLTAVGQSITTLGPGLFQATVPVSNSPQFYRIERSGTSPSPIVITNLRVTNGVATIGFTGRSSEPPSAFTLLSSPNVSGTYTPAGGASPPQVVGPGQFQVTSPTSGPVQFYRVVMSGTNPSPIVIINLKVTNGVATIGFTGASSDPPSAFTLLSSPTVEWHCSACWRRKSSPGSWAWPVPSDRTHQWPPPILPDSRIGSGIVRFSSRASASTDALLLNRTNCRRAYLRVRSW